jgi:hypothetical protein
MGLFGKSDKELLLEMVTLLTEGLMSLNRRLENVEKALNIKTKIKAKEKIR